VQRAPRARPLIKAQDVQKAGLGFRCQFCALLAVGGDGGEAETVPDVLAHGESTCPIASTPDFPRELN